MDFSLIFQALESEVIRNIEEAKEFSQRFSGSADVFPVVMPGTYTVGPEHLKDAKSIADADNGLFTHAAETKAEQADILNRYGHTVIRHMDTHDLLGNRRFQPLCPYG